MVSLIAAGVSAAGLGAAVGITDAEAQKFIDNVKKFQRDADQKLRPGETYYTPKYR